MLLSTPALAAPPTITPGPTLEVLSPYQGQRLCTPVARPGAIALRRLVLASYPGTSDAGIVRACAVGGASEHKEGRAWDWRVSTSNPQQVAQVADFTQWLLAPDQYGNPAAMARRLGIMYMVWDSKIWKSYQASRGWQPYTGASPHTDHVHFSLSWAGAYAKTSYWTGVVAPVIPAPAPPPTATPTPSPTADRVAAGRVPVAASPGPVAASPRPVAARPRPVASPRPVARPRPVVSSRRVAATRLPAPVVTRTQARPSAAVRPSSAERS